MPASHQYGFWGKLFCLMGGCHTIQVDQETVQDPDMKPKKGSRWRRMMLRDFCCHPCGLCLRKRHRRNVLNVEEGADDEVRKLQPTHVDKSTDVVWTVTVVTI